MDRRLAAEPSDRHWEAARPSSFASRDFFLLAVSFLITPAFAALSIADTALLSAAGRSSGEAVLAFLTAVAMVDLMARLRWLSLSFCLSRFLADFLCGNIYLRVSRASVGRSRPKLPS